MPDKREALPTQQFIEAEEVKNGVVFMKGGSLRQIIAVSGVNFDLKSEDEQNAIIFGYQNFLNSLNFTLQIFIHSRKVNIDAYVANLKKIEATEINPLLKTQVTEYREFISSFVAENAIMQKSFFVIVPYDVIEIAGGSTEGGLMGFFKKRNSDAANLAEGEKADARARSMSQLSQRTEQVISGLQQLGMICEPLGDQETIELLYNLYNPGLAEKKGFASSESNNQVVS
jgi:type IV secretory pathway VirB4 component